MPIFPQGAVNLAALTVPGVYVQLQPPAPLINGVPTDILGAVGSGSWGPLDSPVTIGGNPQEIQQNFGKPSVRKYDLGTAIYVCQQQGSSNFRAVRVSDGTDTASTAVLLDGSSGMGAYLTAIYTGILGNIINSVIGIGSSYTSAVPTYKLSVYINGGIPEVFDNIGGSGEAFWENLVNAVNQGQSTARGPSRIVVASLFTGISGITVTAPGTYTALPTVSTTGPGTGAAFAPHMGGITPTLVSGGSGYVVGNLITLAGGTRSTPVVITVDSVDGGGAILTSHMSTAGNYTALPTNPVAQATTSGIGTGATFNMNWIVLSVAITNPGSGYTDASAVVFSPIGATATLQIGSVTAPAQSSYLLAGGTDGATGVTSETLVGDDSANPRTGMYALRGTGVAVTILVDADDPTFWTQQQAFASGINGESCFVIGTIAAGYQDNISGAILLLQNAGIDNYGFKLAHGDWIQINDPFNGVTRYVSPQSIMAGRLAALSPEQSSLNKPASGIIATQKTAEGRIYSDAELSQLRTGRIDIVTKPLPVGNVFGVRLGINTSSNPLQQTDNYTRMVNFLGQTILRGLGLFVGLPQTPTVRLQAKNAIQTFLGNLFDLGMIGDVNNPGDPASAYTVILDASNNSPSRVALGYMQADVTVVLFSIIQYLVVNLNAQQGSAQISVSTPTLLGA